MPEIFDRVLPLNLIANTAIFYVAARLYLLPALKCSTATSLSVLPRSNARQDRWLCEMTERGKTK